MNLKRFGLCNTGICPQPNGRFVRYADVVAKIEGLTGLLHFAQSFLEEAQTIIPQTASVQDWHDCVADWQSEAAEAGGGEHEHD